MADAHLARTIRDAGSQSDPALDALPAQEDRLASLLERGLGLSPTQHMLSAFVEQARQRARSLGIEEHAYIRQLEMGGAAARAEWMAVAPALTVGETFLFRDAQLWKLIESTLLPELASLAKPVWLWSAGCSTGEEAYTLAIVARRALGEDNARILATDVNPKAIAAARVGVYGQWSLRGVDEDKREGLTVNGTQTVRVHEAVKSMVRFETHNLNDDAAYPPHGLQSFEFVVCRNVLIYMSHPVRAKIICKMAELITPGGVLILGHGEAAGIEVGDMLVERHDAGVVYRRPQLPAMWPVPAIEAPAKPAKKKKQIVDRRARTTASRSAAHDNVARRTKLDDVARRAKLGDGGLTSTSSPADHKGRPLHDHAKHRSLHGVENGRAPKPGEVAAVDHKGRPLQGTSQAPSSAQIKCREFVASAITQARAGKLDAAERETRAAIVADSLDPEPHVLLAALMMARNSLREAETELRRALFLDPVFVPALWQIGNLYGITERKRQAAHSFARALTQLEGLPPDTEALPFDNLSVGELSTLLRAELGERVEA